MLIFGKNCENRLSVGAPPLNPRWLPDFRDVTLAYFYRFVDFVSSSQVRFYYP